MKYFNGVIVVEGTGDSSYLSSFINAEYVVLNGYDMPEDVVDYLKHIRNRKILVMTDPDDAGFSIEKRLKETGLKYEVRTVDSKMCNKHGKHGVAECKKEEILRVLDNDLIDENPFKNSITQAEFNSFGFMNSQKKRNEISKKLCLGVCNSKILFKRMNYNGITSQMIKKSIWK
ncbi:MAG: DUF4093 domain-containing protein [Bacilli bacterium]|nr:DUF4093 domain-containing protein [Bacilli bacterium]